MNPTTEEEIHEIERAQDSRAQALGYALITNWEAIRKASEWVNSLGGVPPHDREGIEYLRAVLGTIRHEVGRHAQINAYHQRKIERLRSEK